MCIRDRAGIGLLQTRLEPVALGLLTLALTATLAQALFRDCLLYTSDAADERSSVDLGGRRIIKKNTTARTAHAGAAEGVIHI